MFVCAVQAQVSYRGASAPHNNTLWISGSNGAVKIIDSLGRVLKDASPKAYPNKDFRAIYAWDSLTAIILSVADSTVILRTTDGGNTWAKTYENNTNGIFFDDLDFENNIGFAVADPIPTESNADYIYPIIKTIDSGNTWAQILWKSALNAEKDAGLFSASGSNIKSNGKKTAFCTGGSIAKLYFKNKTKILPLKSGGTYGPYTMDIYKNYWLIAGGNYELKTMAIAMHV